MGMTAVEKVLALKSGQARVRPGDVVYPDPDFIMIHDGVVMGAKRELDALGIDRLAAPEKVLMVTDHDVIYGSARAAERGAFNRKAAAQWGVTHFYDVGRGGHGHIFPMETGMLLPGMFYFDNDRHATNATQRSPVDCPRRASSRLRRHAGRYRHGGGYRHARIRHRHRHRHPHRTRNRGRAENG